MINFDKYATTRTSKEIWNLMEQYATEDYGNPSALYPFAEKSRKAINDAKEVLASLIHCNPNEIYFVPSGSVADNWIIRSFCRSGSTGITSDIEHHAVLNAFQASKDQYGTRVIQLPVDINGLVDVNKLKEHIDIANLVSIMYVNNELGCIQDIDQIGHICRKANVPFHTDAVQAFGKLPINVDTECIDFMSCVGHKFHGPQGIGFLYIRDKYKDSMKPLVYGGSQQRGMIAGTEYISGIVGLATAAERAYRNLEANNKHIHEIHWSLRSQLKLALPQITFNNSSKTCLESCINVCFENYKISGEQLLAFLAQYDICVSSGSACTSQSHEPSHVLRAIGLNDEAANASLRFTFDEENTVEEVETVVKVLTEGVNMIGG